jgi:hypothetical protein
MSWISEQADSYSIRIGRFVIACQFTRRLRERVEAVNDPGCLTDGFRSTSVLSQPTDQTPGVGIVNDPQYRDPS